MNTLSAIGLQEDLSLYQLENGKWIDLSILQDMTGHDDTFTKQLIGMFMTSAPDATERAQQAFIDGQLDEVIAIVHKYKSSLNIMGNPKLPALASAIETACREEKGLNEIQHKLLVLQELTDLVLEALKQELRAFDA